MKHVIFALLLAPVLAQAATGTWEGPDYSYCEEYPGGHFNRTCAPDIYPLLGGVTDFDINTDIFAGVREDDLPQKGWWWDDDKPGEGVFVEVTPSKNGSTGYWLFGVIYSYDSDGKPEWYTFGGPYEHPQDATRWREKQKPFNRLFLHEQAPDDFAMGT